METLDGLAKTTSLQRLIMGSVNETLQRRRFSNVVRRFHRNYMAMSERRWIAISQQRYNNVIVSAGVFRTQLNIYGAFLGKLLTAKSSAVDVRLGS